MRKGLRDLIFSLAMLAVAGGLWWETQSPKYQVEKTQDSGFDPAFFPSILIGIWLILAVVILIRSLVDWSVYVAGQEIVPLAGTVLLALLYAVLMSYIGFLFASILFAAIAMYWLGFRRPLWLGTLAIVFPLATWYSFVFLLKIQLPTSPWFTRL